MDICKGYLSRKETPGQERRPGVSLSHRRGGKMRTDYIDGQELELVLALLMPQNRLICQLAISTGLRIGDVCSLRAEQLIQRPTITEAKTKKSRRIYIPADLLRRIKAQAGETWAFPGTKEGQHKTRQAVWADIKRAAKACRCPQNIGPHTLRKVYAVRKFQQTGGDLRAVQKALNHDDQAVTMLYAMADHLSRQKAAEGGRNRRRRR